MGWMKVSIHEAKTHLSRLIEKALAGEDVVIAKAGRPLVRLTVISPAPTRELGTAAGLITWEAG
jgi:prevent-host-death family protein